MNFAFQAISYGTIPYLGTFLTDLTMIDTAISDVLPDGLINFDKRRKEFEVLAQIKLLQGAANAYHIETDSKFSAWFDSVLLLDEKEAFDLSCKLEPGSGHASSAIMAAAAKDKKTKKRSNGFYHRKNDSIASTASSSSESQFYFDSDVKSTSLLEEDLVVTPEKDEEDGPPVGSPLGLGDSGSGRWSSAQSSNGATSVDSCSNIISSEPKPSSLSERNKSASTKSENDFASSTDRSLSKSSVKSLTKPTAESPYKTSEFYIIRVSILSSGPETEGVIMYKSIMIGNHERTREVIRNAMMKHGLEGSPDNYTLSQVLPDKGKIRLSTSKYLILSR